MDSATRCPYCGQPHSAGTEFCPATGESIAPPARIRRSRSTWWVSLGTGTISLLLGLGLLWLEGRGTTVSTLLPSGSPSRQIPVSPTPSIAAPTAVPVGESTAAFPQQPPPTAAPATPSVTESSGDGTAVPWPACPGAPLSRLRTGDRAYLSYDPPLPNRVRTQAGTQATVLGQINPGELVEILEGPACVEGRVWWKVHAARVGLTGWTAEGDGDAYWLVPFESGQGRPAPRISGFLACPQPCNADGSNATRVFPQGTTVVHARWVYENIPAGARYVRAWTMDGREWVRYDCVWPGPEHGADSVTLTEPAGLHSGTWEVTIAVNDAILLREQVVVEGSWTYWSPAGEFATCYGK